MTERMSRKKERTVVGGSHEDEYALPPADVPANLIDTVGELRRLLLPARESLQKDIGTQDFISLIGAYREKNTTRKSISAQEREENGQTIWNHIQNVLIPQLQERVAALTGVPEATEAITVEKVLTAINDIESGKAASYEFAFRIARVLNQRKLSEHGVRLTRSDISDAPGFEELWQYVRNATTDISSNTAPTDETAVKERIGEFVQSVVRTKGLDIDKKDLWIYDNIEFLRMRNAALNTGTGLQATTSRLLNSTRVTVDNARPTSVWELMRNNLGTDISLPSDKIEEVFSARRKLFTRPQPAGHFVVDRPFRVSSQESESFDSIGYPISRILFKLEEERTAEKMQSEGVHVSLDASYDVSPGTINAFSEQLRGMFTAALTAAKEYRTPEEIEGYVQRAMQLFTPEMAKDAYAAARKKAADTKKSDEARLKEAAQRGYTAVFGSTPPPPDDFSRLQIAFTDELFSRLGLPDIVRRLTKGTYDTLLISGAWRDEEVSGYLTSLNEVDNVGQKRAKIEVFINSLPERINELDLSAIPQEQQERIRSLIHAFYDLAVERRSNRLTIDDARSRETSTLLTAYAEKFGVLVRSGVLPPLPTPWIYPEKEEDEDEDTYNARLAKNVHMKRKVYEKKQQRGRTRQNNSIVEHMKKLLEVIDSEKDLRGIFVGTLGPIIGKQGKDLKSALKERAAMYSDGGRTIQEQGSPATHEHPPYVIYDEKRNTFVQPPEKMRTELLSMDAALSAIETKIDSLRAYARTLESRIVTDPNPSDIAAALRVHESEFVTAVVQPLAELYAQAEKYRRAPTADTQLQWKAGGFMVSHLYRAMNASSEVRERIQRVEIGERIRSYIRDIKDQLVTAIQTDTRPEAQEGFKRLTAEVANWEDTLNNPGTVLSKTKLEELAKAVIGEE